MRRQSATEIEREAIDWLARVDKEGDSPELLATIEHWQAGDTRRRGAFLRAEAAWALFDEQAVEEAEVDETETASRPWTRRLFLACGGGALAAGIAGTLLFTLRDDHYRTEIGEIRRLPLADGSIAAVNSASAMRVSIEDRRRTVRLDEGEAWFQVARDPERPFEVIAGSAHVVAVGTAFAVRRRERGVEILVTEGVVEIWSAVAAAQTLRVPAGSRGFVTDGGQVEILSTDASGVDRALAWRSGKIDLANETLAAAAAEFNRYNRRPIVIADPRLREERFLGLFRADDPEGFAQAVHRSLNVPVSISLERIQIGSASE